MRDAPEKTRFAVQMAIAARALVEAAPDSHRKRVLGRYVFVYLHDVIRFGAPWRNALADKPDSRLTAEAAKPALQRLRGDWNHYQDVRHYIGAKRQPRDGTDPAVDQLESFGLWADIGQLSVSTLVDDAVELYVQLAASTSLSPLELDPKPSSELVQALAALDAVGEVGLLELTATTFGSGKAGTFPARQGGEVGRLVPLLNDIAENIQTVGALAVHVGGLSVFEQLVRCQLPTEIDELLRLSIGSASGGPPSGERSLLDLFREPSRAPEPRNTLEQLDETIPDETRESLHDWRNRIGAHIDADTPWSELEAAVEELDLALIRRLADHVLLYLEVAAVQPGGPVLLLLSARRLKSVFDAIPPGAAGGLSYEDPDLAPGNVPSALPPPAVDSEFMVWVGGPSGFILSAAVAGILAGRSRELSERLAGRVVGVDDSPSGSARDQRLP